MLAFLEGYNKVEYTRNGESKDFVNVYVSTNKEVDYGKEYLPVMLSTKYWQDKISPAFSANREVHVGFDKKKDNKPFLYVKD